MAREGGRNAIRKNAVAGLTVKQEVTAKGICISEIWPQARTVAREDATILCKSGSDNKRFGRSKPVY